MSCSEYGKTQGYICISSYQQFDKEKLKENTPELAGHSRINILVFWVYSKHSKIDT